MSITQDQISLLRQYLEKASIQFGIEYVLTNREGSSIAEYDQDHHRIEFDYGLASRAPPFDLAQPLAQSFLIFITDIFRHENQHKEGQDESQAQENSRQYFIQHPEELLEILDIFNQSGPNISIVIGVI